jgi:hypothetical protein
MVTHLPTRETDEVFCSGSWPGWLARRVVARSRHSIGRKLSPETTESRFDVGSVPPPFEHPVQDPSPRPIPSYCQFRYVSCINPPPKRFVAHGNPFRSSTAFLTPRRSMTARDVPVETSKEKRGNYPISAVESARMCNHHVVARWWRGDRPIVVAQTAGSACDRQREARSTRASPRSRDRECKRTALLVRRPYSYSGHVRCRSCAHRVKTRWLRRERFELYNQQMTSSQGRTDAIAEDVVRVRPSTSNEAGRTFHLSRNGSRLTPESRVVHTGASD